MIAEIFVEGIKLDLDEAFGAELNYAIDDIKDFASRDTNYSKTIVIPGSASNNKVFGHIYEFGSSNHYGINHDDVNVGYNFNPSKQARCQIFVNKIQVFKGVIRLMEIKIERGVIEYECSVFGELGGFVNQIGKLLNNKTLIEDLSKFGDYDQNWGHEVITASWDRSYPSGVVYPLIDYGFCKAGTNDYHLNAFRPAFFVREICEEIIKNAGYTYESNFFNTEIFKSLIIPNSKAELEQIVDDLLSAYSRDFTASDAIAVVEFSGYNLYLFDVTDNAVFKYTGETTTTGEVTIRGSFVLNSSHQVNIRVFYNGSIIIDLPIASTGGTNVTFDVFESVQQTISTNGEFYVQFTSNSNFDLTTTDFSFDFLSNSKLPSKAGLGAYLSMQSLIPKGIEQKDFLQSICRMFNLYIYEDPDKVNHLIIEPYVDFYQSGGSFLQIDSPNELLLHGESGDISGLLMLNDSGPENLDWTSKVDRSKPISIKPMSELNSRYFDFLFTEDSDFHNEAYFKKYNESYGDRKLDSKFAFTDDRNEVKVIFSPSIPVDRPDDDKLACALYAVNDGAEESQDNNIRIMQFHKITNVTNWKIKGPHGSQQATSNLWDGTYYGFASHLDHPTTPTNDISFGAPGELLFTITGKYPSTNLFTAYWGNYVAEITNRDSKLLSCYLHLKVEDISNLDFSRLIYIDGSLWRLNKIIDYNPMENKTTQVELLKVIELIY
jgi:hypothetical protein